MSLKLNVSRENFKILENQICNGNLSHAYLFYGCEEEVLSKAATDFLKGILCREDKLFCGSCNTCLKIDEDKCLDVHHLRKDGNNIKISQIRDMIFDVNMAAVENEWKIYIIHEAHTMNVQSSNALLKTLEEPSEGVIFILLSKNKESILDTIISRATTIKVENNKENTLQEQEEHYLIESMLYVFSKESTNLLNICKKITENKENLEIYLNFIINFLCNVLIYKGNEKFSKKYLYTNNIKAYEDAISKVNCLISKNRIQNIVDYSIFTKKSLAYNVNPQLALMCLFMYIQEDYICLK